MILTNLGWEVSDNQAVELLPPAQSLYPMHISLILGVVYVARLCSLLALLYSFLLASHISYLLTLLLFYLDFTKIKQLACWGFGVLLVFGNRLND